MAVEANLGFAYFGVMWTGGRRQCDEVGAFDCLSFRSCRFEFATKLVNHFYVASDAGYN